MVWLELFHPEDYSKCNDIYCRGFDQRQPFAKECRLKRHDGQYRWMLDIGVPRFHEDGPLPDTSALVWISPNKS